MTKKIGIWLDKRTAKIISIQERAHQMKTITSSVEEFRPRGGSGSKTKGGPQDVVQDSKYLEREKHQLKDYFNTILNELNEFESLVVFGPAETGQKFVDFLSSARKDLHQKVQGVEKAEKMTENQLKAWVREYFEKLSTTE